MDVKLTFLNEFIKEVYVEQSPSCQLNHVFKLKSALYNLKQAPCA